jgi:hypothetical protein
MNKNQMKVAGIVCLVICAICIFVAIERYQDNANNVQAIGRMVGSFPMSGMAGDINITPSVPAATKYAAFLAVLSGVGGMVLLLKSR